MDQEHLRALLGQLHEELARGETLDGHNRQMLQTVHDDIERIAAAPEGNPPASEQPLLRGRWQEAVIHFESSHPQLAANLEQTMNALSNLGL